jgi:mono/diheme cytochrome c family protein
VVHEAERTPDKDVMIRGAALCIDQCAGCHMEDGGGLAHVFPPLKDSAAVQAENPAAVLEAFVNGVHVVATKDKPTGLSMPAFGWKLSNDEIADLATYIRNAWGNHPDAASARKVAKCATKVASCCAVTRPRRVSPRLCAAPKTIEPSPAPQGRDGSFSRAPRRSFLDAKRMGTS